MACSIQLKSPIESKLLYHQVLKDAMGYNFTHNGSYEKGVFAISYMSGKIIGEYTTKGNNIQILISRKPMLLSCSIIKQFLNYYINK